MIVMVRDKHDRQPFAILESNSLSIHEYDYDEAIDQGMILINDETICIIDRHVCIYSGQGHLVYQFWGPDDPDNKDE